jgi:Fic family protein
VPATPAQIAFSANFRRYTPEVSAALARIGEALGVIRGARLLPAVADELRASARVGTVHYSNLIEGNELPLAEAERATRGELAPETKAKIELINCVAALDLLDARLDEGTLELTPDLLLDLHRLTTGGLGRADDPHFKPWHEGAWRDGVAVVVDRVTRRVMHEGPPPDEVEPRIVSMLEWLGRKRAAGESPFVLAGVVHYGITDVHPFADGNGRVARLFQTAVLLEAGALPGRMFSFEHYYAQDRGAYYDALRSVRRNTLNMEAWLAYFLTGVVEEYERVADKVLDLSSLLPGGGAPLQLTGGQQHALGVLRAQGRREFSRREYEEIAAVSRSTAGADLRVLVAHGVLRTRGAGPSTRYVLAPSQARSQSGRRRGRALVWSEVRIERELRAFVVGRDTWPGPQEFRAAGMRSLYAAASRTGGIRRWRRILGY